MRLILAFIGVLAACCGCASSRPAPGGSDVVFIVTGVEGNSGGYAGLVNAVWNETRHVQIVSWGAPAPLMVMNFSTESIHDEAEKKLAETLVQWRHDHPTGLIDLIGHSAGCGVSLGAIAQLADLHVNNLILLAPSVSPGYDLNPALAHIDGVLHVFHSDRDTGFLDWRTSTFGTYDRIKTRAAGNAGFAGNYPAQKVIQHPYDPKWESLGYDGGHFSVISGEFAKQVIAPLLQP